MTDQLDNLTQEEILIMKAARIQTGFENLAKNVEKVRKEETGIQIINLLYDALKKVEQLIEEDKKDQNNG